MATPALRVTRGDTLTWTLTVASDITGWTPRVTVKTARDWASAADTAAVLTATAGAGLTVTDAVAGTIALSIAATVTAALEVGVYVWDLQLVSGAAVRTVEWDTAGTTVGSLTVSADVSRTA